MTAKVRLGVANMLWHGTQIASPGSSSIPPHRRAAAASERDDTECTPRPPRILLVEDDPIIAIAIRDDLSASGFDVVAQADNGPEAVTLAERYTPDLIVMDVRLRGRMTGIDAAREIKSRQTARVVFATAFVDAATRAAMSAVGYEALLPKPYTPEQLVSIVAAVLKN